jgi:hypothetical protein
VGVEVRAFQVRSKISDEAEFMEFIFDPDWMMIRHRQPYVLATSSVRFKKAGLLPSHHPVPEAGS